MLQPSASGGGSQGRGAGCPPTGWPTEKPPGPRRAPRAGEAGLPLQLCFPGLFQFTAEGMLAPLVQIFPCTRCFAHSLTDPSRIIKPISQVRKLRSESVNDWPGAVQLVSGGGWTGAPALLINHFPSGQSTTGLTKALQHLGAWGGRKAGHEPRRADKHLGRPGCCWEGGER